jgi:plasmid stabilization system protein ParE
VLTLRVRARARQEIESAFEWYVARSSSAARGFLVAVDEAFAQIAAAPEQYPFVRGRLRRVLLHGYPYAVYFKSYPDVISVIGVIHGHRHPRIWFRHA